jgi:hypothetical protein
MGEMLRNPFGIVLLAATFLAAGLAGIVAFWALGGHPKPATDGHLKTGHHT